MKNRKLFVAFLAFSRIEKICNSTAEAIQYERELREKGINPVRTEIYPESFVGVDYSNHKPNDFNTTLH